MQSLGLDQFTLCTSKCFLKHESNFHCSLHLASIRAAAPRPVRTGILAGEAFYLMKLAPGVSQEQRLSAAGLQDNDLTSPTARSEVPGGGETE